MRPLLSLLAQSILRREAEDHNFPLPEAARQVLAIDQILAVGPPHVTMTRVSVVRAFWVPQDLEDITSLVTGWEVKHAPPTLPLPSRWRKAEDHVLSGTANDATLKWQRLERVHLSL